MAYFSIHRGVARDVTFVPSLSAQHLGEGALLALNALRCMAIGCDESEVVAAFDSRFGVAGRAALGALFLLVREIAAAGRRPIAVAAPGSCRLTADEAITLALLSAGQARDDCGIVGHVAALLAGRESVTARRAAVAVGGLFKAAGLTLEVPCIEALSPARPLTSLRAVEIGAAR